LPAGCPIENDAACQDITDYLDQFLVAKNLYRMTEDPSTQRLIFEKLGLYADPELHIRLEAVYARYLAEHMKSKVNDD
jgi:hypothetical protein